MKNQDTSISVSDHSKRQNNVPSKFTESTRKLAALACNNFKKDNFDMNKAVIEVEHGIKALGAMGGLQEMIATQMLSIHHLQQMSIALANASDHNTNRQYHTNAAVKLANSFIQQAILLAKLQGNGGQKIIVEHVEVHNGGQAVVGNFSGTTPTENNKK